MSGREMAAPWTPELQTIRKRIEEISESSFNSSLLNFHHDGSEGMGCHSAIGLMPCPKAKRSLLPRST
jgi:hypothetical protein